MRGWAFGGRITEARNDPEQAGYRRGSLCCRIDDVGLFDVEFVPNELAWSNCVNSVPDSDGSLATDSGVADSWSANFRSNPLPCQRLGNLPRAVSILNSGPTPITVTNSDGPTDRDAMFAKARTFDNFAGIWVDPFRHELHVLSRRSQEATGEKLQKLVPKDQTLFLHVLPHTMAELDSIMDAVVSDWQQLAADGIYLSAVGIDDKRNCVELSIDPVTPNVVAKFTRLYGDPIEFQFSPRPLPAPSTWPTEPEVIEAVEAAAPGLQLVTCGEHPFPASVLAQSDVEDVPADLADDLQAGLNYMSEDTTLYQDVVWRLAYRDDASAQFVGKLGDGWVSLDLERDAQGWRPAGGGDCHVTGLGIEGAGGATWVLDPDFAPPTPDSTELHLLVTEAACAGGIPAFGRIVPPVVVYGPATLTLTAGVRPVGGIATCPSNPPTPATVVLPRVLGDRVVYAGNVYPPGPPGSAEP